MKSQPDIYTIESVLMGHPDKVCDQISDLILDSYLSTDETSRVAVECLGCPGKVILAGEVSSYAEIDINNLVSGYYNSIGYHDVLEVLNYLSIQSNQLSVAVEGGRAGDQGVMYGYACNSPECNYLPCGPFYANTLAKEIDAYRLTSNAFFPDGKIQITVANNEIIKLIVSVQHSEDCNLSELSDLLFKQAVAKILPALPREVVSINKDKGFISGGYNNDTGVTGRKIMVDTYGGLIPHGGGSFSGKDPSKVDRSAAYMARFAAKNIVANGLANECIVSVAYEFGEQLPVMLNVITDMADNGKGIMDLVKRNFDFRPGAIIDQLSLNKTSYLPTATYGHFTNCAYPWEQITVLK